MQRNLRSLILAAVATAGLVTGCASVHSGGNADELTLWTHNAGNPEELAVDQQVVNDFNAHSAVKIKVQAFPQQAYNDAVVAAASARKLPCLLDIDAPTVPNWSYAGYLAPLDLPQDLVSKNLPSTLGHYQGKLYSIGTYDAALGVIARKSVLQAAGVRVATLDHPWTAAEFADALQKIKALGKAPITFDLGTGDSTSEWWSYGYSPFLQSFGGDMINRTDYKSADGALNGPQALAWANWMQNLVRSGYTPKQSGSDAFADFVNGKSAMVWSGIWNAAGMAKLGSDAVVMPPPDLGHGPKIGGGSWQWAVSAGCTNKTAAQDFLKLALSPKYVADMATHQNVIPATDEAAALAPGWGPGGTKRFFLDESKKYAQIRPPTPAYPFVSSTFAKLTQDIVAGGDPKTLLDQAVRDIDANLKSNNYYAS